MTPEEQETAKQVARQAHAFCFQFEEGIISMSEFFYAVMALEAANSELILTLHNEVGSEHAL